LSESSGIEEWVCDWRRCNAQGPVFSSPTVVEGFTYFGSDDGSLFAVPADSNLAEWTYSTSDSIRSSPTVVDGTVYVGSDDTNLYAIEADTGSRQWFFGTRESIRTDPTFADGTVFVGSFDDTFYAVEAGSGDPDWRFDAGRSITASATVVADPDGGHSVDSRVVYGSSGHHAYGTGSYEARSFDEYLEADNRMPETDEDENIDEESDTDEAEAEGAVETDSVDDNEIVELPGFGIGTAVAGIGGAAYLFRRRANRSE